MKLPSWSARERRLGLVVAGLVGIWIIGSWVVQPLWNQVLELHGQATTSQAKLVRLRELARRAPAIEQAYQRYADRLSAEPPQLLQQHLLDELERIARDAAVQINLKPRPIGEEGQVERVGVEVDVDAPQAALWVFLDRLFATASLIDVERLRISTTASKDAPLRATLVVNRIIVRPVS